MGTGTLNGRTIHTNTKAEHFSPEVTQCSDGSSATLADSLALSDPALSLSPKLETQTTSPEVPSHSVARRNGKENKQTNKCKA